MASKDLLQDTVEYNRKVNLTRKMLKSMKPPLPALPLMLGKSMQAGEPARAPVGSGKVIKRHVAPSKANNRLRLSKKPKNFKLMSDHVLDTPMAKLRRNYEVVLSRLQPAVKARRDTICPEGKHNSSLPEPSKLPRTQSRVPPSFVDELLDSVVISDVVLKRYQPALTSIAKWLDSLPL